METDSDNEVLEIFKESKALLSGHFILRSGMHSEHFFQCAQVCQYMDKVTRLAELLINKLNFPIMPNLIVSPAMGGLVIGQEVARQLNCRFIFLEKVDDRLALRRNFSLSIADKVLLVEDVVTRGGRVKEALDILNKTDCEIIGVTSLVDRSTDEIGFKVPFQSLLKLQFPTYKPSQLPPNIRGVPAIKPGS